MSKSMESMVAQVEEPYIGGGYLSHNPDWHVDDSPWKAHQIAGLILANRIAPHTICDVGCGAGEVLVQLKALLPNGIEYHGYEISPQAHSLCKQRAQSDLHFHLGDITQCSDQVFDLLLAIDVFEHVGDYIGFLRGLKQRGKQFVFHIPLDLSLSSVVRPQSFLKVRRDVGHLHYFCQETAIATLEHCGYKILDHQLTAGALEVSKNYGSLRTLLANIPRRVVGAVSPSWATRLLGGWSLLVLA
jgi:SAM-dependent methyltransferase